MTSSEVVFINAHEALKDPDDHSPYAGCMHRVGLSLIPIGEEPKS